MSEIHYKKLAAHNSVCNPIYFEFQDCLKEKPFRKWIGGCTEFGTKLEACIRSNREKMRERNLKLSKERSEKYKQGDFI